jgi:protein-disulfide isomerase
MSEEKKLEFTPALSILCAGVLIAGAILFTRYYTPGGIAAPANAAGTASAVSIRPPEATDHIRGSASAKVVLVEYSDFQCPYCSLIYPTLKRIENESNGSVAWIMRNLPLESIHPQARPGALAGECVAKLLGNDAYWKFADTVFANQSQVSPAYYKQVATGLGAQSGAYDSCITSKEISDKVDTDTQEAYDNGAQGTPFTVAVAGGKQVPFSGALPYAQIKSVINSLTNSQ